MNSESFFVCLFVCFLIISLLNTFCYQGGKILTQLKMGLISDRKSKAKKEKENSGGVVGGFKNGFSGGGLMMSSSKKGIFGPQVLPAPLPGGHRMLPQKYPPGYYTTPVHHSSWSHPSQPKGNPNVNPRYQTWVAPRKQPALGQLVMRQIIFQSLSTICQFLYILKKLTTVIWYWAIL